MIEIKRIAEATKNDINIPNEPFTLWGKMIPIYDGNKWAYTTEKFEESKIIELRRNFMRKILFFIFSVLILISLAGCVQTSSTSNKGFSEDEAISMVIKDHPEFPSNKIDTLTKKLPTGGPSGATADVKFKTNIEKSSEDAYNVTLIKDWSITVNGTYVKSSWKYKVTSKNVDLVQKVDNDYLPGTMK